MWEKKKIRFLPSLALKIKDLDVKSKSLQLLEENVGKYIRHQVEKDFLYKIQTYNQIRGIYLIIKEEKVFAIHITKNRRYIVGSRNYTSLNFYHKAIKLLIEINKI